MTILSVALCQWYGSRRWQAFRYSYLMFINGKHPSFSLGGESGIYETLLGSSGSQGDGGMPGGALRGISISCWNHGPQIIKHHQHWSWHGGMTMCAMTGKSQEIILSFSLSHFITNMIYVIFIITSLHDTLSNMNLKFKKSTCQSRNPGQPMYSVIAEMYVRHIGFFKRIMNCGWYFSNNWLKNGIL